MQDCRGIELASLTDLGCQRENNEDRHGFWQPASDEEFARKGCLAVVADGMGGYEGGQEASRIAVETVQQIYSQSPAGDPQQLLADGLIQSHQRILQYAEEHPNLLGMGTTCTAIAVVGKKLYFAHIGDSRLYLLRGSNISHLTRDHSYVGRLVESGAITQADAETHAQRHILTAALGAGDEIVPDIPAGPLALHTGDTLILCSDGLWGPVKDNEIAEAVADRSPAEGCRRLVELARERGGPDNITVEIIRLS